MPSADVFKPTWPRRNSDGTNVCGQTRLWYGRLRDHDGRIRRVKLCNDLSAARTLLTRLQAEADRERATPHPFHPHRGRPVAEHLSDWRKYLASKGREARYYDLRVDRAEAVFKTARIVSLAAVMPSAIVDAVAKLRSELSLSEWTAGGYLDAVKVPLPNFGGHRVKHA